MSEHRNLGKIIYDVWMHHHKLYGLANKHQDTIAGPELIELTQDFEKLVRELDEAHYSITQHLK
jgi:hypothetical protein